MRVVRSAGIGSAVVLAVMGSAGLAGCCAGTGAKEATIESAPRAERQDDPYPALSQPCDVARAEPFRGRLPDTETIAALRRATGASAVRIAPPGRSAASPLSFCFQRFISFSGVLFFIMNCLTIIVI